MDEYRIEITAAPQDWDSLTAALDAARRRRPRDQRIAVFVPSSWKTVAVPSRAYRVEAPAPWWQWARAWRP